ncbi:Tabersonine 16-O-methyltransferase [Capsicum chinense]|nr:Tabersonine 16-O-methyltransferase [Capsicum chinense]
MTLVSRGHFFFTQHLVVLKTTASVSDWLQNNLPIAFETAHRKSYWDYFAKESEFGSVSDNALASDSRLISNLLISNCCRHVFEGLTSLVDIGGGIGSMAMAIVESFPSLKCIVLDFSHVIGDLKGTRNLEFVAGSMFDKIPRANAILLKISHWDYFVEVSEFCSIFDDAMSSDSRLISTLLISDCCRHVFEELTLLVDFGGGIGAMVMAIVEAFLGLKCIVLDLSPVIGDLKGTEIWNLLPGNMPLKSTQGRGIRDQSAPQPIYPDPLGEHFSHAEFRAAFTILPHSVKS